MRKYWPQMAFPLLFFIILISTGAQPDSFQQTRQVQPAETKWFGSVGTAVPQMWGAVGDGVHNDAAAIQAAIDSGATEIFLPNLNPNAQNPGKVPCTNYNLGATSLTITKPIGFRMAVGTSLVYTGTDAPLVIECHAGAIEGLALDLYDVYSTGDYCLKVVGDGIASGSTAAVARARIKAHWLAGFKTAGFFTKHCLFCENELDLLNIRADITAPNAWGYYFDPADQLAKAYLHEANRIKTITVNSRRALYGGGGNFGLNEINVGLDIGGFSEDPTLDKYVIGGINNAITISCINPHNLTTTRTIHFLPNAVGNTLICSSLYLSGITDEAPFGANIFQSPRGRTNYLKNSSFESWNCATAAPDWDQTNATIAAITGPEVRHGLKGIAITSTGANGFVSQTLTTDLVGKDIILCGWFKAPAKNTSNNAVYLLCSAGGASLVVPRDGLWHFLSVPYTVPAGAANLKAYIWANNPAGGADIQTVYADGLVLTTGSTPVLPDEDPGKVIYGKAGWDPGSVKEGGIANTKVGCMGAAAGDPVSVGFSTAVPAGAILSGSVTASDIVTVTLFNQTGARLNLEPGMVKAVVRKNEN